MALDGGVISRVADMIVSRNVGLESYIVSVGQSVDEREDEVVVVVNATAGVELPADDTVEVEGQTIRIRYRAGPPIIDFWGDIRTDRAMEPALGEAMGGHMIQNMRDPNRYGTLGVMAAHIGYETQGAVHYQCGVDRAIMSCNHVIALWDSGATGDVLASSTDHNLGVLSCWIPLNDQRVHADLALGQYRVDAAVKRWEVRQIGTLAGIRKPVVGEAIKKFGARTGYAEGVIEGIETIYVDRRRFDNVYRTTPGFGCPGDSGSAVIASNNDLLGIYSWGQQIDCSQSPKGYFWRIVDPGWLLAGLDISIDITP